MSLYTATILSNRDLRWTVRRELSSLDVTGFHLPKSFFVFGLVLFGFVCLLFLYFHCDFILICIA